MKKIIVFLFIVLALVSIYFFKKVEFFDFKNNSSDTETKVDEVFKDEINILVGDWVSVDDKDFSRTFNNDYTFSDSYGDEGILSSGVWFIFDNNNSPENFPYTIDESKKYLVMNDSNKNLSFIISSINDKSLELIYLEGSGVLKFEKEN